MIDQINTIKKAIILAAGFGKRMEPLTLDIPKPLIKVNGTRMIDSIVRALYFYNIKEIYVVVGYKKEMFEEWVKEYSGIVLIDNPYYSTCNNISSLYVAREYIGDSFILDGDQIINNLEVLNPRYNFSGYNASWCDKETKEWLLSVEDDFINGCSRTGGVLGWQLYSISRWSKSDGLKLKQDLEELFEKGYRDIYWDDVVIFIYPNHYKLKIYKMDRSDVVEIDSLEELSEMDKSYKRNLQNDKKGM